MKGKEVTPVTPDSRSRLRVSFFGWRDIPLPPESLLKMGKILVKHKRELAISGALVAGASGLFYIRNKKQEQETFPIPTPKEIVSPLPLSDADRQKFTEIYDRLFDGIFTFTLMCAGNKQEAEDLTQQVFLHALRAWPRFDPEKGQRKGLEDPYRAWLYRIARNLAANWSRDKKRHPMLVLDEMPSVRDEYEVPEESGSTTRGVSEKLGQLSPNELLLLVLKHVEELSNKEIGVILGKSEGAIKTHYHRILVKLGG